MFYDYPSTPHERIHGPGGYLNYDSYKEWLRDEFEFRCVYCLRRERWAFVDEEAVFGVDHIFAKSIKEYKHLECEYTNLVYCCNRCNAVKLIATLLDPCKEAFSDHLLIQPNGRITWHTDEGKRIVKTLALDGPKHTRFRQMLSEYYRKATEKPDGETARLLRDWMAFPEDLPDLGSLRPPQNSKPEGITRSHFERRKRGELPDTY